jgi:hypothetical protein
MKTIQQTGLRRIIALCAAYAVVLSSLIAAIGAASAVDSVTGQSGIILCHSEDSGQTAPSGDSGNSCDASCCIGCLMSSAALPPPPAQAFAMPRACGAAFKPVAAAPLDVRPQSKSHLSQGPPFGA